MSKHSKENIHLKYSEGQHVKICYVQPTLDRAKSDGIIVHVGTNDVSAKRKRPSDIADSII